MNQHAPLTNLIRIAGAIAVLAALAAGSLGFAPVSPAPQTAHSTASAKDPELAQAQAILDRLAAQHPILRGVTIEMGDAEGYQAVAYPQEGRIVVSPDHTALLTRVIAHEAGHIVDYRDNGRIDWGENVHL